MARFDWYQATVLSDPQVVMECLAQLDQAGRWEPLAKAPHGYGFGSRLVDPQGALATVWWGGMHKRPHVLASGEGAQGCAELLRANFEHRVSRADVCIDYAEPDAYPRLEGLALQVAKAAAVKVGTAGDHLLTKEGRTLYLGATTSAVRLRLYEKADELRAKLAHDPVRLAAVPEHLTRLEAQVRPHGDQAKFRASFADPMTLMGSSAWLRELMRLVADVELEPFEVRPAWRQSDDDRAYAALLAQYGGLLKRICLDLGEWDLVGRQLGHDLAEREAAERRR